MAQRRDDRDEARATASTNAALAGPHPLVERARRVLAHEQRTSHQDAAVRPGGVESFIARWADEVRAARERGELGAAPGGVAADEKLVELLSGYATLDPMQRTARVRAALALLDGLSGPSRADVPGSRAGAGKAAAQPRPGPSTPSLTQSASRSGASRDQADSRRELARPSSSSQPAGPGTVNGRHVSAEPRAERLVRPEGRWPLASPPPPPPILPGQQPRTVEPPPAPRPEDEYLLQAPVTAVPGVGQQQATRLARLGIETVRDLLEAYPREHRDYSKLQKIGTLPFDEVATVLGLIWEVENVRTSGGRVRTLARISDETGALRVSWFNQPYLLKQLPRGSYIVVTGVKQRFGNRVEFSVKSHELPEQGDLINTGRLVPVYPLTEGLHPKAMRRFTKWAVDRVAPFLPEHLPPSVRSRADLLALPEAVAQIHYPDNERMLSAARRRLAFDELFLIQLGMLTRRARAQDGPPAEPLPVPESLIFLTPGPSPTGRGEDKAAGGTSPAPTVDAAALGGGLWPLTASCFEATLPFRFTGAQRRAIREILADLARPRPMSRLLQGDVGSGKTAVAAAALLAAAANGAQGALLAPTEILAEQHYRNLSALLAAFGLHVVLLTGGQKAKERAAARDALANGQAAVAIGTHALIQDGISFKRLGLAVVDEQHRFGVEQRNALREKGYNPHMLVMTATPIPRTLALTLYGDLDVSVLDELPAGRQAIITRWRAGTQRQEAYRLVAEEAAAGRQAYIICPLVEESEALEAKSAIKEYERLKSQVFPDLRLGLVHGQVKPAEKDRVMRAFRDGEIDVLVATAVVEVGVDVPNATVMLIEDADRFGLSQLHQFRGRVGRGQHQSYCYLLSEQASMQARERLSVLEQTSDGFALAEADLRLRGPGDFFGTRQSGLPDLKVASLADTQLLVEAREQAEALWARDPYLQAFEHRALRERVFLFWRDAGLH
jgi:ATP-dependent DNA helicase RecG